MVFEDINLLFSFIDPLLIFSNPAIVLNIVVLPIPEGPNKHIISPLSFIEKDTFFTFVLPPAQKSTFFTSKNFYSSLTLNIYFEVIKIKVQPLKLKIMKEQQQLSKSSEAEI